MKRMKLHISARLLWLVALLLVMGCLVAASGITFARYRVQQEAGLTFQTEKNAMVYLGVERDGAFALEQSTWFETVDGTMELSFAVSNGRSAEAFSQMDQLARVRLVASLGAWSESSTDSLVLTVGESTYTATVERIAEGSALYSQFGDGWIFRFLDDNGQELTFSLEGGQLSYTGMQLRLSGTMADTHLLQLRVVAEKQ